MCGIAGLLSPRPDAPETVARAIELMRHRGPDGQRVWHDEHAALGFVRLAILDLTDCGMQPMSVEDDPSLTLVFNGEIYNYRELREELQARGHVFRSTGDSEVILHAYREWGRSCVERFNGMWGLAIWDADKRELFCSRDRFGVKPFYWALTSAGFAFASEIKVLLSMDRTLAKPDYPQLYRFLRIGQLDEGKATFFERVQQLPASHSMVVDEGGRITVERYWDVAQATLQTDVDVATAVDTFRELMTDAVRLRLRSDVPVGTCLSGGLDSSTIVALAGELMERRVSTFTSYYPGTDADESQYAHAVSERMQTDAHWIEPSPRDFFDVLPGVVWHQDEPTAAPGIYSQWHVMQLAQPNVKVLLDGQGGDEILGGYTGFFVDYTASMLWKALRYGRVGELRRLRREYADIRGQLGRGPLAAAVVSQTPPALRTLYRRAARDSGMMSKRFAAAWGPSERVQEYARPLGDPLADSLLDSLVRSSLPALLHYEDRDSMAFSIEARTPFLDYRLVPFCLAAPYELKVRGWETKVLLREAMADVVPPEVLARRDKKGYPTPLNKWLREGLMPQVREILLSSESRARGVFDIPRVEALLDKHERGEIDAHWEIWRLLTVELWFQTFIDAFGRVSL